MDNARIARAFDELADRLELSGEEVFKLRAYRGFAEACRALPRPLSEIAQEGGLLEVPGVGKAIAKKVEELLATGTFQALEEARVAVPDGVLDLRGLPGVGAKTARALWTAGITGLPELVAAADDGRLESMAGLGKKKITAMVTAAKEKLVGGPEMLLGAAFEAASLLEPKVLRAGATRVAVVAEARRGHELVPGLELLATGIAAPTLLRKLQADDDELLLSRGAVEGDRISVELQGRGAATIDVVPEGDFLGELVLRTGGALHVAALERAAKPHGGLMAVAKKAASEEALYAALGMAWVPPELRDDDGAHGAARELVEAGSLGGVFHVHTEWSDGRADLTSMIHAAKKLGYGLIGISEHSKGAHYAHGLDEVRLEEQATAVERARKSDGPIVLHGIEVDVLEDGTLDFDDATLMRLDFVIASVHTHFKMSPEKMTERIVRAVSHPLVTILGHPTGRLLLARKGYVFDLDRVAKAAAANDTYLEINANPHRLDLSAPHVRRASAHGVRFVINPDAHSTGALADVALGVAVARRAGIARESVLNARPAAEIARIVRARKEQAIARLG